MAWRTQTSKPAPGTDHDACLLNTTINARVVLSMTYDNTIEAARRRYYRRLVAANGRNDEQAKTVACETFYQLKRHYERLDALDDIDGEVPEVEGYESWYEFKRDWYL